LRLLKKHDPNNKLYFTKKEYLALLIDVFLQGMQETNIPVSEDESLLITQELSNYVAQFKHEENEAVIPHK